MLGSDEVLLVYFFLCDLGSVSVEVSHCGFIQAWMSAGGVFEQCVLEDTKQVPAALHTCFPYIYIHCKVA